MLAFWRTLPDCAPNKRLVDGAGMAPDSIIETTRLSESETVDTTILVLLKLPVQKHKVSELTVNSPDA